jgi:SAM-dependent methyltransferase
MKLADLLKLKNAIDEVWQPHHDRQLIENILMPVYSLISNAAFYTNLYPTLEETRQHWDRSLDSYHGMIRQIVRELDNLIKSHWPDLFSRSESNFAAGYDKLIELDLDQNAVEYVQNRVRLLGDWRKPGIIIRPGSANLIPHWVGFDPLYLADTHDDLMKACVLQFPPLYQGRLRKYVIKEPGDYPQTITDPLTLPAGDTALLLGNLPSQQFDSCLVYNFFNYKRPSTIQLYLKSIFKILAPGGRLLCTINDCDRWAGAINAEQGTQTFSPLSWFIESSTEQGFDFYLHYHLSASTTWIELTKPGFTDPWKAGQTLARVYNKSPDQIDKILDNDSARLYTASEVENLIMTAVNLNIDTVDNCRNNYTPQQLSKLIKRRMKQS